MDVQNTAPQHATLTFDYLTMQTEWLDWIALDGGYDEETGPVPIGLVAECVKIHALRFTNRLLGLGILWNSMTGTFGITKAKMLAVKSGAEPLPTGIMINGAWEETFEATSQTLEEIETLLTLRGELF